MTQNERLEQYLRDNIRIDPLTAWNQLGIYRLAARINELRKKGLEIRSESKTVYNKFNEKCHVADYKLVVNNG